ncbi:hypothetical protein APHAL10511_005517 [Amanita phalloides]|nr:hypothetical protein APHAL10511_005517 [Amanita phalloides]
MRLALIVILAFVSICSACKSKTTGPENQAASDQATLSQQCIAELRDGNVIPEIRRGPEAWKVAVQQWDNFLKDWPPAKYTGRANAVLGAKRNMRRTVALEFDKYGRDETRFLEAYPMARVGIRQLVAAIRNVYNRERNSINGSPQEREAQKST